MDNKQLRFKVKVGPQGHEYAILSGSEPVTITTNVLGSCECSHSLQVFCCALGGRACGSLSHRKRITAHG